LLFGDNYPQRRLFVQQVVQLAGEDLVEARLDRSRESGSKKNRSYSEAPERVLEWPRRGSTTKDGMAKAARRIADSASSASRIKTRIGSDVNL
jgi:hypothetical protein